MRVIMPSVRRSVAAACALAVLPLAGCGGDGGGGAKGDRAATATVPPQTQTQTTERRPSPPPTGVNPLLAPPAIPRVGTEEADPDDVKVLARWLKALREGRDESAARLFALPSKVQNGTPVLTLKSEQDRYAFGHTFPCGAKIKSVSASRGYLVVEYVLTERPGGVCGAGTGNTARGAVRVEGGKITEWYRLEEAAAAPGVEA